jgi:hypothetical protein
VIREQVPESELGFVGFRFQRLGFVDGNLHETSLSKGYLFSVGFGA